MGQAAKSKCFKEADILNMKQKEIIDKFRQGNCNLLVSTSVLEEGVDIPACNVIIKFDLLKTYCDYVQSKGIHSHNSYYSRYSFCQLGRARKRQAFYCLMVNEKERVSYVDMLLQFHSIEQKLLTSSFAENDMLADCIGPYLIPPYSPFGVDGPQITMQSSISLVNRCLSSHL